MTNLHNLLDAFDELEQRANAVPVRAHADTAATPPGRRHAARVLIPVAALAAVALPVATVVLVQHSGSSAPTARSVGAGSSQGGVTTAATHPITPRTNGRYQPPSTGADLTAQTRAILAGIATIEVTDSSGSANGTPPVMVDPSSSATGLTPKHSTVGGSAPAGGSGAAIVGTLTAAGRTGGFDLNAFLAAPGSKAMCDADTNCSVRTLTNGTSLAVGSWHDSTVPGGVTYQVEMVRRDGADVLLHLSTEHDPKGQSTVTTAQLALTVDQMISFVTSDRW